MSASVEPGFAAPAAAIAAIPDSPERTGIADILARPDLRLTLRSGGRGRPIGQWLSYWRLANGPDLVAVVGIDAHGRVSVRHFTSLLDHLAWLLESHGGRAAAAPGPNYLPPPMTLASFVYALHVVDSFRRASYQAVMDGMVTEHPFLPAGRFRSSLRAAVRSADVRWLLPAMLTLTPGVRLFTLDERTDPVLDLLEDRLLVPAERRDSGEEGFAFGEAGTALGMEFLLTWRHGVGIELAARSNGSATIAERAFWAPTGQAEHLARFQASSGGSALVNHQALTTAQLGGALAGIIGDTLASVTAPADTDNPTSARPG